MAAASLHEAIRMAHEAGFPDPESEILLRVARVAWADSRR